MQQALEKSGLVRFAGHRPFSRSVSRILGGKDRAVRARRRRDGAPQCATIRLKLAKIGAAITRNTRRVRFHLSSACPERDLFRLVAARLEPG